MNKKISILIVDDDADLGDSLSDILEAKGCRSKFVTSGKEALSIIKEEQFDAIFLDIKMPEMNGVETLNCIKKSSPLTSVVMITAYAEDKLVEEAMIEGALKILKKPLDLNKIMSFIEKLQRLKTLLIVDDNKEFCDTLRQYIDKHSYNVSTAHSVTDGIEKYDKYQTEFLLIDMKLNGNNGLEIVNAIREAGSKSSVILMSGYADEYKSLIDDAIKNDVDHFIAKPFQISNVIEMIGDVTRKRLQEVLK
ncbi:MAG: response regulator [Candidatus Scalindua sp.]|jgi:DNA-binding NtrC family response regulator|nr:response regulator [Candidatus Scalindua sp.]MBT5307210.1 response regulator [Candidatus Scalindua sp.]MBT6047632.1 response regulator [Candidatus Scalindua sp.]MBT6230656.1 response regulator [Candidatus Scalindua sp.]MBT6564174.1 response regulator [Candidatus Scalindua sp.]